MTDNIENITSDDKNQQLRAAVYGLAVADALGVPVEFNSRGSYHIDDMIGYGTHHQPAGTWSDDTSMTLATCDSLRENNLKVNCGDMQKKFREWNRSGKYTTDGHLFDIGITVAKALDSGRGACGEYDNGNGSLMRIAPLAFIGEIDHGTIEDVSAITHGHPISRYGCTVYVRLLQDLASGTSVEDAVAKLDSTGWYGRLHDIADVPLNEISSSGYVVHTFEAALWALVHTNSYEECVLAAVNMGNDTDTVGAVAGALAGVVYGYDAIPKKWLDTLRAKDVIDACLF